jgi:hypothetical protein
VLLYLPWEKIIQENSWLGLLSVSKFGIYFQVEHIDPKLLTHKVVVGCPNDRSRASHTVSVVHGLKISVLIKVLSDGTSCPKIVTGYPVNRSQALSLGVAHDVRKPILSSNDMRKTKPVSNILSEKYWSSSSRPTGAYSFQWPTDITTTLWQVFQRPCLKTLPPNWTRARSFQTALRPIYSYSS